MSSNVKTMENGNRLSIPHVNKYHISSKISGKRAGRKNHHTDDLNHSVYKDPEKQTSVREQAAWN